MNGADVEVAQAPVVSTYPKPLTLVLRTHTRN